MRIAGLFVLLLVLGWSLSWPATEPETLLTDSPRDVLVLTLTKEILTFIKEDKLSEKDQNTVRIIAASLISDLPLKTIEEIKNDDAREKDQPGITGREFKEQLRKKLTDTLVSINVDNHPLPTVSPDLAYDLERLDVLDGILRNSNLGSEALDILLVSVITRLFTQTEA